MTSSRTRRRPASSDTGKESKYGDYRSALQRYMAALKGMNGRSLRARGAARWLLESEKAVLTAWKTAAVQFQSALRESLEN